MMTKNTISKKESSPVKNPGILEAITNNVFDAILFLDTNINIKFWNRGAENLYGWTEKEALGQNPASLLKTEYPEAFIKSLFQKAGETGELTLETYHYTKDGKRLTVELHLVAVKDKTGVISGYTVIMRDITERKQTEKALRESERRYKSTLDNLMEGCVIWDFNWMCVYVNDAAAKHAHLSKGVMTGKSIFKLFPGIENTAFYEYYSRAMHLRTVEQFESPYLFPDGLTAWFEMKVQPVPEGIFLQTSDITERKVSEDALSKALRQLQFHVENSPLAVIEFNSSFQIIQWSKNAEKIFGWSADEVKGKSIGEFKWVYEEDAERVAALSADMLASEKTSNVHTNRNYRKDGSVIICEWYNSALVDDSGSLISVFSLILDVTERKNAENELHHTLDALKRSNADLEQFAYAASHDLQEPLRMISTYTTVLERSLKKQEDDKTGQYFQILIESSRRMHSLIEGLLQYSRISSEKEEFRPVELSIIVSEVIKLLEIAVAESHAQIKVAPLPVIIANPVQMKQLFQNLITNAIKYRGERNPVIEINAEKKDGMVTISVKDNGIGISAEYFDKIFVIFQRLNDRSVYPGTGIGLSICKRIAENHGGRIWLQSEPGTGSTFFFTIPDKLSNFR